MTLDEARRMVAQDLREYPPGVWGGESDEAVLASLAAAGVPDVAEVLSWSPGSMSREMIDAYLMVVRSANRTVAR